MRNEFENQQKLKQEKKLKRIQQQQRMRALSYYRNPKNVATTSDNVLNETINSGDTTITTNTTTTNIIDEDKITNIIDDNKIKITPTVTTTIASSIRKASKSSNNSSLEKRKSTRFITSKANSIWDIIQIKPRNITTIKNDNVHDNKSPSDKKDSKNNSMEKKRKNYEDEIMNRNITNRTFTAARSDDHLNSHNLGVDIVENAPIGAVKINHRNSRRSNKSLSLYDVNDDNNENNGNVTSSININHNGDNVIDVTMIDDDVKPKVLFDSSSFDIVILEQLIRLHYPGVLDTNTITTDNNNDVAKATIDVDTNDHHVEGKGKPNEKNESIEKDSAEVPLKRYVLTSFTTSRTTTSTTAAYTTTTATTCYNKLLLLLHATTNYYYYCYNNNYYYFSNLTSEDALYAYHIIHYDICILL